MLIVSTLAGALGTVFYGAIYKGFIGDTTSRPATLAPSRVYGANLWSSGLP